MVNLLFFLINVLYFLLLVIFQLTSGQCAIALCLLSYRRLVLSYPIDKGPTSTSSDQSIPHSPLLNTPLTFGRRFFEVLTPALYPIELCSIFFCALFNNILTSAQYPIDLWSIFTTDQYSPLVNTIFTSGQFPIDLLSIPTDLWSISN